MTTKTKIIFEMETSDPDDFMTLLWLADHPDVDLLGVVLTPGSHDQCQLARWGLDRCGRQAIPIGALHGPAWWTTAEGQKAQVSSFHYKAYDQAIDQYPVGEVAVGPLLLADLLQHNDDVTVLVGAPPKNIGKLFQDFPEVRLARWLQQGGFAGDNLVATPLAKFKGRITCPSFNPGGAWLDTLALLASPQIQQRLFVSKNVCHGVIWSDVLQANFKEYLAATGAPQRVGLTLMMVGLDRFLADKGRGKAMHDLVAAACALDERVCHFQEVEIYREKGDWGALAATNTRTRISVGFDEARFINVLAGEHNALAA